MINLRKLKKALGTRPDTVTWFKKDEYDYITDGRFLVKIESKRMTSSVISTMVDYIGKIPQDGEGFRMMGKDSVIDFTEQMGGFIDMVKGIPEIECERTDLIQTMDKINLRVFARTGRYKSDKFVRVNEKYADLVEKPDFVNYHVADSNTHGIIASNDSNEEKLLILPVYLPSFNHKYLNMDKGGDVYEL